MSDWTIIQSKKHPIVVSGNWGDEHLEGVLTIEEDEFMCQRARLTAGFLVRKVDVAWAWEQFNE